MAVDTILLSDFTDPRFCAAFRAYFAELDIPVRDWDGLFREMNGEGNNRAFLLLDGEETAGFLQFQMNAFSNWFFEEPFGFIREFWVAPGYRRRGYGSLLLERAENYFLDHGAHRVLLTAGPDAVDFYLAGGYEKAPGIRAKNQMEVLVKALDGAEAPQINEENKYGDD